MSKIEEKRERERKREREKTERANALIALSFLREEKNDFTWPSLSTLNVNQSI